MSETSIVDGITGVIATYELLDRVRTRQDLVIRDDQFDFSALLEAAGYAGRRRIRLSLLDTGRFGLEEIESLAKAGARILTSDTARPSPSDGEILQAACRGAGTRLSVLWEGPLPPDGEGPGFTLSGLEDLLGRGVDFHLSDRLQPRDPAVLARLAAAAKAGRGYFVLYHAGPLAGELIALADERVWVHFADADVPDGAPGDRAVEIARAAARAGSRAVVHVERGLPLERLEELWAAGAALLFKTPPSDERSLLRPVERKAARRRLPARAYRITTAVLP